MDPELRQPAVRQKQAMKDEARDSLVLRSISPWGIASQWGKINNSEFSNF
jgi:hypothetical protein